MRRSPFTHYTCIRRSATIADAFLIYPTSTGESQNHEIPRLPHRRACGARVLSNDRSIVTRSAQKGQKRGKVLRTFVLIINRLSQELSRE